MTREEKIQHEVDTTLESFEAFEPIEPGPFFAARVQANIAAAKRDAAASAPGLRFGRWRPALVMVMLVFNVLAAATAITLLRSSVPASEQREQYLAALASEYSLDQNQYYLYLSQ